MHGVTVQGQLNHNWFAQSLWTMDNGGRSFSALVSWSSVPFLQGFAQYGDFCDTVQGHNAQATYAAEVILKTFNRRVMSGVIEFPRHWIELSL